MTIGPVAAHAWSGSPGGRPPQPRPKTGGGIPIWSSGIDASEANFDDVVRSSFSHCDKGLLQVLAPVARYHEPDFPSVVCARDIPVASFPACCPPATGDERARWPAAVAGGRFRRAPNAPLSRQRKLLYLLLRGSKCDSGLCSSLVWHCIPSKSCCGCFTKPWRSALRHRCLSPVPSPPPSCSEDDDGGTIC
jgi:hypothetical protein